MEIIAVLLSGSIHGRETCYPLSSHRLVLLMIAIKINFYTQTNEMMIISQFFSIA